MYDKRFFGANFFASDLGKAALVSVAAMVTFVVLAAIMPGPAAADAFVVGATMVELA